MLSVSIRRAIAIAAICACPSLGLAADPAQPGAGCPNNAAPTQAATPPAKSQSSGTAPGDSGSTGWSGGTGGSNIGTSQDGPTSGSPTTHPETAKGLDPTKPTTANPPNNC